MQVIWATRTRYFATWTHAFDVAKNPVVLILVVMSGLTCGTHSPLSSILVLNEKKARRHRHQILTVSDRNRTRTSASTLRGGKLT